MRCGRLVAFEFEGNKVIHRNMKHDSICHNTFVRYAQKLTKLVEPKICNKLLDRFAVDFNGWSVDKTHYIAIFGTFPAQTELGF